MKVAFVLAALVAVALASPIQLAVMPQPEDCDPEISIQPVNPINVDILPVKEPGHRPAVEEPHLAILPVEDPFHAEILPEKESAHKLPVDEPIFHIGVQPVVGVQPINPGMEVPEFGMEQKPIFEVVNPEVVHKPIVEVSPIHVPEFGIEQKPIFEVVNPTVEERPLFGIHPVDPINVGVLPVHTPDNKLPVYEEEDIIVVQPIQKPDGQIAIMPIMEEHIVQIQPVPGHSILPVDEPQLSILPVDDPFHAEILPEKESAHKLPVDEPIFHIGVQPVVGVQPIHPGMEVPEFGMEQKPIFDVVNPEVVHKPIVEVSPIHVPEFGMEQKPIFDISSPTVEEKPLFGIHPVEPINAEILPVKESAHRPAVQEPIHAILPVVEEPHLAILPVEDPFHAEILPEKESAHKLPVNEPIFHIGVQPIVGVQPVHPGMDAPEFGIEQKPIFEVVNPEVVEGCADAAEPIEVMPVKNPFEVDNVDIIGEHHNSDKWIIF